MEKLVLTGGPGSGKSSIILALEIMGEHVVCESAEDYIRMNQARGIKEPWLNPDFQIGILELQINREEKIPAYAERVWIDRGIIDGLAYAKEGTAMYKTIEQKAENADYEKIFLIEQLETCEKTDVRRENKGEAGMLERKLEDIYKKMGYEVIRIPAGKLEDRINSILEKV